ncbi:phenol 2-monooxygenase (NADPH) [Entomortierella parvispora]|uniref:Phenol 2-monooxygenase (NADPH) n=1 Tax=Entomortierella parvispora TaxID=205924 RepID=A0A9P3M094_9FUNG|nr:phenol 2-monooxygenase (NADPH) [Entomortierella parvispora]
MLATGHSTPRTTETPVLISGAGPTGLYAAALLAKMNIPCRIIERDFEISPLSKALAIHARSQEILAMTSPELIKRFEEQGSLQGSFRIYYDGKLSSDIEPILSKESIFSRMLLLPQSKTVKILTDTLEEYGVTVQRGWELVDTKVVFDHEDSWVETKIRRAIAGSNKRAGESQQVLGTLEMAPEEEDKQYEYEVVKSRYLIAADGGRSAVRHKINMPFPGRTRDFNLILFDGLMDSDVVSTDHLNLINGKNNRTVAMFPLGEPKRVRIMFDNGTLTPEGFDIQKEKPLTTEHFQKLLDDTISPLKLTITKVNWLTYYRVNERRAEEYSYKGRIFLAGDAAHVHSPAGGQGMNTGLQDAYNLAWKIAMVVNGTAPPSLLNSYNEERPLIGDEIIKLSAKTLEDTLGQDFMHRILKRAAIALAPVLMPIMANRLPTISMLGLRYHANSLNKNHKSQAVHVGPGEVGCRAGDNALVAFVSRPSDTTSESGSSDSDHEDSLATAVAAAGLAGEETIRLHQLMAHPGVFQILVFTGNQWKAMHQPATAVALNASIETHLSKWRANWPSNRENKASVQRPQFMVHTLTTLTPEKAPIAVESLSARAVGEGKPYRDLGKELHRRYGVDPAVKKNPEGGAIIVVRPDSHISYRVQGTGPNSWKDVNEYFESILV